MLNFLFWKEYLVNDIPRDLYNFAVVKHFKTCLYTTKFDIGKSLYDELVFDINILSVQLYKFALGEYFIKIR